MEKGLMYLGLVKYNEKLIYKGIEAERVREKLFGRSSSRHSERGR
jgi:hypothetical protein